MFCHSPVAHYFIISHLYNDCFHIWCQLLLHQIWRVCLHENEKHSGKSEAFSSFPTMKSWCLTFNSKGLCFIHSLTTQPTFCDLFIYLQKLTNSKTLHFLNFAHTRHFNITWQHNWVQWQWILPSRNIKKNMHTLGEHANLIQRDSNQGLSTVKWDANPCASGKPWLQIIFQKENIKSDLVDDQKGEKGVIIFSCYSETCSCWNWAGSTKNIHV